MLLSSGCSQLYLSPSLMMACLQLDTPLCRQSSAYFDSLLPAMQLSAFQSPANSHQRLDSAAAQLMFQHAIGFKTVDGKI